MKSVREFWLPFVLFCLVALLFSVGFGGAQESTPPSYEAEVKSLQENLTQAAVLLRILQEQHGGQSKRVSDLGNHLQRLREQLADSEKLIKSLESQLTTSQGLVTNLQGEVVRLKRQLTALRGQLQTLSRQHEDYRNRSEQAISRLESERLILRILTVVASAVALIGWLL